jgi:hypothetical protein
MEKSTNRTREDQALIELRKELAGLGIKTRSSEGTHEYFYAYLHEKNGVLGPGSLFIMIRDGHLSWSRDSRLPISDIPGAARRIAQVVREGSSGAEAGKQNDT